MEKNKQYFGRDLEAMGFAKNYHKWILEEISPFLGKYVAEIGAGNGDFSQFILDAGVDKLFSFEPSENMYKELNNKYLNNSIVNTLQSYFGEYSNQFDNTFDSVCYINVLEHIQDDGSELAYAYNSLKYGGNVVIFVPALSFLYSDFDKQVGHFRRYTKKQLYDVMISSGFNVTKIKYFDIAGIIPWYIAFVLLKKDFTSTDVALYDDYIVPIMQQVEKYLTPFIGKNLIAIGTKKT